MKSNREKTITIVAIIASVLVLSVGFAAFTGSLKFSLSASVSSDSSAFKVQFSSGTTTSSVKSSETIAASNKTTGLTAGNVTLDNSASTPSMSNTEVVLTKPGDFAEYSFYAVNTGEFDAYLDSITYTLNSGSFVTCTASTGTDATLVSSACSAIKVKVTVGDVTTETTKTGIASHKLEKGSYEQVKVRIYYDENGSRADGNFSVSIGDITLAYTSIGGATMASNTTSASCFTTKDYEETAIITGYTCEDTEVVLPSKLNVKRITGGTLDETLATQACLQEADEEEYCTSFINNIKLALQYDLDTVNEYVVANPEYLQLLSSVEYDDVEYDVTKIQESAFKDKNITSFTYNGETTTTSKVLDKYIVRGTSGNLYIESLIGSKHSIEVMNGISYNFYVLSKNNDGTLNLIAEKNMCSDGSAATASNTCLVAWDEEHEDNTYGPITAMSYLETLSSNWTKLSNITINYTDEKYNFDGDNNLYKDTTSEYGYKTIMTLNNTTTITASDDTTTTYSNLKARLPYMEELINAGCTYYSCPTWLVGYLSQSSLVTGTTTIEGIEGYWTASAYASSSDLAWYVYCRGRVDNDTVRYASYHGVRPVIQVSTSLIE